jgi:methylaspartate ammonia-lyase
MRIRTADSENGAVAVGDCAAVQYSGAGGRDPLFLAETSFRSSTITSNRCWRAAMLTFLTNARFFDELRIDGHLLHTAVRYGLSQALLDATALATGRLKTEVVCDEWQLPCVRKPFRYLVRAATTAISPSTR